MKYGKNVTSVAGVLLFTLASVVAPALCLSASAQPSFAAARVYPVGLLPQSIAIADFNGDGRRDLAVANYNSWNVSVLLNDTNAGFQAGANFNANAQPWSIAAGDFNADGKIDLATANMSDTVSALLGNGDGSFSAPIISTGSDAFWSPTIFVAAGDFNGDGNCDLVTANFYSRICVLLSNGDGSFQLPMAFAAGSRPTALAVADLNKDGKLDVAVASSSGVYVLLGNGDGTLQDSTSYTAGATPQSIATGDLNGDGNPDLVVASLGGTVFVFLGNGDGTFQNAISHTIGAVELLSIATADFNGDGKLDVVVANLTASTAGVLLGNGDGTLEPAVDYYAWAPGFVTAADMDGDSKVDVIVANRQSAAVTVLTGNGDGTFPSAPSYGTGVTPLYPAAADFNNDGKLDLAVPNSGSGSVSVLLGNGDGGFQPAVNYTAGSGVSFVVVGDVNVDGKLDLIVANWGSSSISVLLGNGDGTFQVALNYAGGWNPQSLAVADFNSDGDPDVALGNENGGVITLLLGNGDGSFAPADSYAAGSRPWYVATADFNRDGRADLATVNLGDYYNGDVSVLLGNGDGTFQTEVRYATGAGSGPVGLGIADINGDTNLDVVVANRFSHDISVLLGNGDGTFRSPTNYAVGLAPSTVAFGDFNGDHKIDVALGNGDTHAITVVSGNGDGSFGSPTYFAARAWPSRVIAADFNGDRVPDLIGANLYGDSVSVLLNNAVDVTPPILVCPTNMVVGTDPGLCSAVVNFSATATDLVSQVTITYDPAPGSAFPKGTNTVQCTAKDEAGNVATCSFTITVEDRQAPIVHSIVASPNVLWPPNHAMMPVTLTVVASDNCEPPITCRIVSVTSNPPGNGALDWQITGDLTAILRAERPGDIREGRVYTISVQCTDSSGNTATKDVTVVVPHSLPEE